jgi:hypothetical protein
MSMFDQNLIVGLVVIAVIGLAVYSYAPQLIRRFMPGSGLAENFAVKKHTKKSGAEKFADIVTPAAGPAMNGTGMSGSGKAASGAPHAIASGAKPTVTKEVAGFADYQSSLSDTMGSVPMNAAKKPQDCYPREMLNPVDLLPQDVNNQWAQVNPTGAGDIQGKNFLSAGALIGVNTIGQSLRNANQQLRSEPANPQIQVGPWQQSTIEPDLNRRPLE